MNSLVSIFPFLTAVVAMVIAVVVLVRRFRFRLLVPEGYVALLYHQGRFAEVLKAGAHVRWGRDFTTNVQDIRQATLTVIGQEVLLAENVGAKFSLVAAYQVTDPVKAAHATQNWTGELYTAVQLALRQVAASTTLENVLGQRVEWGSQLLARVQPRATELGVTVQSVEVRDILLPADLKRAFAEVLKAKHEGQAALERARAEQATLRSLANAARLMEEHPALLNLRLMQTLADGAAGNHTLVMGVPGGFVPMAKPSAGAKEVS